MKKFIGAICSAVAGILTFIWLSLDWCVAGPKANKMEFSGWELIANKHTEGKVTIKNFFTEQIKFEGYKMARVFAIIMLVVACLLIVSAVVMLLKNLNVLKVKLNLSLINNILLAVFVAALVLTVIGLLIMRADILDKASTWSCYAGVGLYLQAVTAVAACACGWALARKDA